MSHHEKQVATDTKNR